VARTISRETCIAVDEKHLLHKAGCTQLHVLISTWMEDHGYLVVNGEQTIFMKQVNNDWIMHELFVDDLAYASTGEALLKRQFIDSEEYKGDFEITCEDAMSLVEQDTNSIRLHIDM
jgi:hypothetical protein